MHPQNDMEAVFDRWVRDALQERFALAPSEPLPEALLRLLEVPEPEPAPSAA